jgi:hypothetical protein
MTLSPFRPSKSAHQKPPGPLLTLERAVELDQGIRQEAHGLLRLDPQAQSDLVIRQTIACAEDQDLALDRPKALGG